MGWTTKESWFESRGGKNCSLLHKVQRKHILEFDQAFSHCGTSAFPSRAFTYSMEQGPNSSYNAST
jgi:hypothetical protein